MSDPPAPPFTQTGQTPAVPEFHFDNEGRAWVHHAGGNWSIVPPSQPTTFDSSSNSAATAQPGVQPTAYNFPAMGGASTSAGPSQMPPSAHAYVHVIDPSLMPLPEGADLDLTDPATIAKSRGRKSAAKVAGIRQKTKDPKGKKRRYASDSNSDTDAEPARKRGRRKGSPNFKPDEVNKLLDLVEKYLPLGQKGWKTVTHRYQKWSRSSNHPERDGKALENKYKSLIKTKKPTGDAYCPPEIKRAHQVEGLLDERAGARELSDSDVDGPADGSSDDSSVEILGHSTTVRTAVALRAPTPPLRRNTRMNAPDLVNKLSHAFDPDALKSRDDERSQRSFQTTQIFTISQQLRDAQATIESLRNQITTMQTRTHDVERARDRAELKLDMIQDTRRVHVRSDYRVNKKIRCEELYPDGGACTYWVTDHSSDESDKENKDPSPPSHVHAFYRSPSPFDLSSSSGPSVAGPPTSVDAGM
ncbi:hypothetical protein B0H17DRAFT_1139816 [Mycena rosella]|uniref:DUF6818 domain-containing protein n=1 Tax=Mycena rosella TaxID=1033263 RepID=A0AAD7D3A9_MYCRO|nr:hypothetical protein B0H17DRAFT_1139816 [Mycena rosella]